MVVAVTVPMKILTPVLAIDCVDLFGDDVHACVIYVGRDGIAKVFTLFGITGAQRVLYSHGPLESDALCIDVFYISAR